MEQKLIYSKAIIDNDQNKPWLVMVHGFVQNHKLFNRQAADFKDKFNILLVDLRGHGNSIHIKGPYGIEEYADDLELVIDDYKIKDFYYWATHTGTAIGLVYTLRHSGRVRGMVLEGTVLPGFEMPRVVELIARARRIAAEEGIEAAKKDWFEHADWYEYTRKHMTECRGEEHRALVNEFKGEPWISPLVPRETTNVKELLNQVKLPLLVYNGAEDLEDFLRVADYIKSKLKETQIETIQDTGAFPCWENPNAVNQLVGKFLNDLAGL